MTPQPIPACQLRPGDIILRERVNDNHEKVQLPCRVEDVTPLPNRAVRITLENGEKIPVVSSFRFDTIREPVTESA